jgi:class 3 adenylate cyclase
MEGDSPRRRRKLSAILMADVSGFSRMMGAAEDDTVDLIEEFHARMRALVEQFEGRVVNTAGDSVFGEFDSVVNAVACARRMQEEQATRNRDCPPARRLVSRIGVHLGDVIVEDYRVYGDGVNIAARLEPLADPGGICISEAVYQQVRSRLDVPLEDMGLRELKNIEHPIRVYKVPPPPGAGSVAPAREVGPDAAASAPARREDLLGTGHLILLIIGVVLLLSPIFLFPTAGVFPTAGAILIAVSLGRAWARWSGQARRVLAALGVAVASGALWTDWSRVTNMLFVLVGAILAALGARGGARRTAS